MPTMPNPYGYASPIGAAMSNLTKSLMAPTGGGADTLALRRAQREKVLLEAEALRREQAAQGGIARLFSQAMGPLPEAVPPALFDETAAANFKAEGIGVPTRGERAETLVPELMREGLGAGLKPKDIGTLAFTMMKMAGAPDARAAAVFPGLIGVNDAVSLADRETVAGRNQMGEIAKIFAAPVQTAAGATTTLGAGDPRGSQIQGRDTFSTARADLVNRAAEGEALNPLQTNIVGGDQSSATPRNYLGPAGERGITLDGMTDAQTGAPLQAGSTVFTGQVQSSDAGGLTKTTQTVLQKDELALRRFDNLLSLTRAAAGKDPMNFGIPGFVKGKLQDINALAQGVAQAFGSNTFSEALTDATARAARNPNISPEMAAMFDPSLPELETLSLLMAYAGAEAMAGQEGRSVSDRDVKVFTKIVGNPQDWFMSQPKFMSKMDTIHKVVRGRAKATEEFKSGTPSQSSGGAQNGPSGAPVVKWRRDAQGRPVPLGGQ